jgi:PPOX class probable F420-dependent enzyme
MTRSTGTKASRSGLPVLILGGSLASLAILTTLAIRRVRRRMQQLQQSAPLARAQYIRLSTYRRSGEAVATPVWFAMEGATVYVETDPSTGKFKRLRHTPRVELAPCTFRGHVTGPTVAGQARILTDPGEIAAAQAALTRKYRLVRSGFNRLSELLGRLTRKPPVTQNYIAITLARSDTVGEVTATPNSRLHQGQIGTSNPGPTGPHSGSPIVSNLR